MSQTVEQVATHAEPRSMSDRIALPALITASGISALGNGLTMLAVPWFVLVTTGSAARTGLAAAATAVAMVIAGALGGTLVDRLGFKRASIISDLASAVTVALIPTLYFLDVLSFWMLLVLVFLGAVLDSPGSSARRAMIPSLVKRAGSTLERANSAMQFAQLTTGDLLAPLAAGLLIGFIGAASVLYINTATFVLSVLIVAIAVPGAIRAVNGGAEVVEPTSYLADMKEGFRYVVTDPFLTRIMPVSVFINFLVSPMFVVVLPVLANDVFDSPRAFGVMVAGFGGGAALSTIAYGAIGHRLPRFPVYWGSLMGAAAGFWLLSVSTSLWMAILSTVVVGIAIGPLNAASMVIMQARVPERMMGRVFGLLMASSSLATPAGLLIGGIAVQYIGLVPVIVAAAAGVTAAGFWILASRELKALVEETEAERAG